jgi:peptidoglycan/xylan/chitin deacetylase (PgdA/CDA1 family)
MATDVLTVVQCWDDGVTADVRLTEILRRHDAKATFNLNAGLHEVRRAVGFTYQGAEVARLGWNEMRDVYAGFGIANHSLTHPHLDQMTEQAARREIVEGRDRLEQFFGQPVRGFAYPFGTYSEGSMNAVREAGHVYARTTGNADHPFPPHDAMTFHPSCHFLAPDFWARYEKARAGGVFYFWGHAYELSTDAMWTAFEDAIAGISAEPAARWGDVVELFER